MLARGNQPATAVPDHSIGVRRPVHVPVRRVARPAGAGALRAMIWRMRGVEGVPTSPAPRWSRRALLAVAGLGAAGALTGCRVRLEDDAPRVPLLPTRQPIPDEGALLQALADARDLQAAAAALGGARTATPARLAAVHARQVAVLEQVLRSARVPQSSYAATSSPATSAGPAPAAPSPSGSPTTAVKPTRAALAQQEALAVQPGALTALAGASPQHLPLMAALTAQRAAAATLLGGSVHWPASRVAPRAAAPELLAAVRSATYGLEVVATQAGTAGRARALAVLATLRPREEQLQALAGTDAGAPPLGYRLPFAVTTPASAVRLARALFPDLLLSVGSAYGAGAGDRPGLVGLVRWSAQLQAQAGAWGAAPTPFPGLATP
jgi:hypothetical protein